MTEAPTFDLEHFLKNLPKQPGVYRMLNKENEVIYVGKAKVLKNRVTSYFRGNNHTPKTQALVANIHSIEITVTVSETEALILENNLIKQYQPRYNVLLRDDKSYPYLLITDHKHPRITMHRGARKRKGEYFGPFPSGAAVAESLRLMQKIFPVRQCEDSFYAARSRPCLQYQLKRCSAPCVAKVTDDDYQHQVQYVRMFLQGKSQDVLTQLVDKMEQASASLAFERAAQLRDQIAALRKVQEQQFVSGAVEELDIIGFDMRNGVAAVHVLFVREHKVLGTKNYFPKIPRNAEPDEVISAFITQFYFNQSYGHRIPKQILCSVALSDRDGLNYALSELSGRKVEIKSVSRGEKQKYQNLADKNAAIAVTGKLVDRQSNSQRYQLLQEVLKREDPIQRMECFDISHTLGEQTVASCVVFNHEGPNKSEYRRYNVEGITPGDDYAAMSFALHKRYAKLKDEDKVPDIIFIDGGKGQLARAEQFFADWTLNKVPMLVGIAKGEGRKPGLETLIFEGGMREENLPADSIALHLIQHIRDEAHRFAITGHRAKRGKVRTTSQLEQIEGIGAKRRQALLTYFGGLQGIKDATVVELEKTPGISKANAQKIYDAFHET